MDINTAKQTIANMDSHKIIWDDNLRAQANNAINASGGGASNGGFNTQSMIDAAKQINQYQIEQNQPIVGALGSQIPKIQDQYTQLVNSIKGNQQVSVNSATLNANNEFARRGIQSGGAYDTGLQQAVLPVNAAYSQQLAQTGAGSIQDLNSIALQIAQAQAGNASGALQSALSLGGLQQQSQALAQQQFLGTSTQALGGAQAGYYGALGSLLGGANRPTLTSLVNGV